MNSLLVTLAELIEEQNSSSPAIDALIDSWHDVIYEIKRPYDDAIAGKLSFYFNNFKSYMEKTKGFEGITEDSIKELTQNLPIQSIVSKASVASNNFVKSASLKNDPDLLIKEAGVWEYAKMLSVGTLKYVLPFVGLVFALVNLYYCSVELYRLTSILPDSNIKWYDIFNPPKIHALIERESERPEKLSAIVKVVKSSYVFADEFISFLTGFPDGIKDIIFMILDFFSMGATLTLDIGISLLFLALEWALESVILPEIHGNIVVISNIAVNQIKSLLDEDKLI